ncbi:MAG: Ig-like domain-containing protein, partial [Limisphaerales bacterium]
MHSDIVVVFSEPVSPPTATTLTNYTIANGAIVSSVTMGSSSNTVVLATSGLTNNLVYSLTVQNVRDLFGNSIISTTVPIGVYPAATLWLRADTGVTTDSSGLVSQWLDLSGNNNTALQSAGPEFMPTLLTNAFNGQPAVHFDGTNNYLVCLPTPSLAITGDISIYAVSRVTDYLNFNGIAGKTTVNLPASFDYYLTQGSGRPQFYRGNGSPGSANSILGNSAPSIGVPHLVYVTMKGANVNHYLDGRTNGAGVIITTLGDNGDALSIGSRSDLVTKMKGDFAEILIFGSGLSDSDRISLDTYLGARYGIATGASEMISLTITRSGSNVVVSWPTPTSNFNLEVASEVTGATWMTVTNGIVTSSGTN